MGLPDRPRGARTLAASIRARQWAVLLGLVMGCRSEAARKEFDQSAANASATQAAAIALLDCDGRSGPEGPGQVEVQFAPSGRASQVRVLPEGLSASARGACIERVFRFEAAVPAFRGSSSSVQQTISAVQPRPPESAYPRVLTASEPQSARFDRAAARLALFRAARQVSAQCQLSGGPSGSGQVRLQFGKDGKVQSTELVNARFRDTPTGECITKVFALVSLPPFMGTSSPVLKAFAVGDGVTSDSDSDSEFDFEAAAQALAQNPPRFDQAAAARALKEAAHAASACSARDAWGWGEVQVDFMNFGLVDRATLLGERFAGSTTGDCVTNAFRKMRVPLFAGPTPLLVQDFEVRPSSSGFDEVKAQETLLDAARVATACSPKSGPKGPLEVAVRFGPDGHVAHAVVLTEAFQGSVAASCVGMVFRRNPRVPAFEGPAPPLLQAVEIH